MLSALLLIERGEMIFIVPRSFTSGPYFRLFREKFFRTILLKNIHVFNSRKKAFKRDNVLQENIILKAVNEKLHPDDEVIISTSESMEDIEQAEISQYAFQEVIDMESKQKILYIPLNHQDKEIIRLFKKWNNSFERNFIKISTGPVVAFRKSDYLVDNNDSSKANTNPLIWITNTKPMKLIFPSDKNKKQYIIDCSTTQNILVKNMNYVLLRRFSTKDDISRLIATPYFAENFTHTKIGIENHLNYIYKYKGELNKYEVMGIAALLNSTLFDTYFRTFNGNTQVSATELQDIPLPDMSKIESIGVEILKSNVFTQHRIDSIINEKILA